MSEMPTDQRITNGMRAQMELRRKLLEGGAKQVGWKVGFGAPAAKEKLGITMPLIGFLLDTAVLDSGATASLKGWKKPVAEPEIAVHLRSDVPPGADRAVAESAIAAIGPAIELADLDHPIEDIETVLAGDIFQRHVLLGPRHPSRASALLDGMTGHVSRSGKGVSVPADLEMNTGDLIEIVRHVGNVAAHFGERLRGGQYIICGSVTPPQMLEPDDTFFEWKLEPVGQVSVHFHW